MSLHHTEHLKVILFVRSPQNEGSSDQPRVAAFRGRELGGALLLREGEAKRGGLLLLYHCALLHHSNGGVHRPTVSAQHAFCLATSLKNAFGAQFI